MMDFTKIDPLYYLSEVFTVEDAAVLAAGYDPTKLVRADDLDPEKGEANRRVGIMFSILTDAINAKKLKARLRYDMQPCYMENIESLEELWRRGSTDVTKVQDPDSTESVITVIPNWKKSTIDREEVIEWLKRRGFCTGFFFPMATDAPDYLDKNNPRYAHKLAAAVQAWLAFTELKGKSPKQALLKWLRENAAAFSLTDDEGKLNETGIEEIAKVVNWQPGGGAPKTPSE